MPEESNRKGMTGMGRLWAGFLAGAAMVFSAAAQAQNAEGQTDGTLLSSEPCMESPIQTYQDHVRMRYRMGMRAQMAASQEGIETPPFDEDRFRASLRTPEEVAPRLAYDGYECLSITYASDGLVIAGIIWKPVETEGESFPLLIVNRGGNRQSGGMHPWRDEGWFDFVDAGFVVLASQYREGPGSEGRDEFGGADVNDVLNLIPLAEGLGYVDTGNTFMMGESRGGLMSLLTARRGMDLKAIALYAPATSLHLSGPRAEAFARMYSVMIPGYAENPEDAHLARNASLWADELTAPVILFHGTADWRVDPQGSVAFADAMREAGNEIELHLLDGDDHGLIYNEARVRAMTLEFFSRYLDPS